MWSGIRSVTAIRIGFCTWIWSTRHCELGQEVDCWFQCWFHLTNLLILLLLMWKWMALFQRKNHFLICWGWPSLLNRIGALTLSLWLKLPPRKLEPLFVLWSALLLRLACIFINLPYSNAWNTSVMSGLVLLVVTVKIFLKRPPVFNDHVVVFP